MLAKKPDERFATPREVAVAMAPFATGCNLARLAAAAAGDSVADSPLTLPARTGAKNFRFRRPAVALGLACLVLAIALAVMLRIRDRFGHETPIEIPDGAEARIGPDGQVEVKVAATTPPGAPSTRHSGAGVPPVVSHSPTSLAGDAGENHGDGPSVPPLLITPSGEGYWIAGQTETIQAQWKIDAEPPAKQSVLAWRMVCGQAVLASGRQNVVPSPTAAAIAVQAPSVRAATEVEFHYRLEQTADHKVLQEGKRSLHLYPDDLLAGVATRLSGKRLLVWDDPDGMPALLAKAKIGHARIGGEAELQFTTPDIVLVGNDRLSKETLDQSRLLNLAAAGANVLILRQTQPPSLAGYSLTRRAAPARLAWQEDHPLARERLLLDPAGEPGDLWALRLPADDPVLEIAWWPVEAASGRPVPIDTLVAVKALGRGRLVLCQIPLGPWPSDPRSQRFLADALDYLLSPVQATTALSRRQKPVEAARPEIPTIRFPSGGSP